MPILFSVGAEALGRRRGQVAELLPLPIDASFASATICPFAHHAFSSDTWFVLSKRTSTVCGPVDRTVMVKPVLGAADTSDDADPTHPTRTVPPTRG